MILAALHSGLIVMMYIRFETRTHGEGLFAYAAAFNGGGDYWRMARRDRREFDRLYRLLCVETPAPPAWAYRDDHSREPRTWFRERAAAALVERAWLLCLILNEQDVPMHPVKSDDPGPVIWEDEVQVVVRPVRVCGTTPERPRGAGWNGRRTTVRRWRFPHPIGAAEALMPFKGVRM